MAVSDTQSVDSQHALGDSTAVGQLVSQMRHAIEDGQLRPGDKVATLRSLAEQYDISFDAARGAIARLESMGYLTRKRGSGTFVAHWQRNQASNTLSLPLQKQRNQTVAMLLDNKVHHYGRFYDHLIDCLQLGGYGSSVFTWRHGWGDAEMMPVLQKLDENPPHAIVVQQIEGGRYYEQLNAIAQKHGIRVVCSFLANHPMPEGWHSVLSDSRTASAMATRHLLDHGHQRIGLVLHQRHVDPFEPASMRKRWTGHSSYILGAGDEVKRDDKRHVLSMYYNQRIDKITGADASHPINRALALQWLKSPDCPTAFIGEDFRLAALLQVAKENNIQLPDNFELVGIGNTPWSSLMNFSSVWLREDLAAQHVINLIQMNDALFDSANHRIMLQPQLVKRP
ncbi:MAG: hypothetical protein CMJ19_19765 [Phycisphaeraceae bacterium]|nr:hypothetical protein [Phycisphaeraceae bacterium]